MTSLVRELRREDPPVVHGNMLTVLKIAQVEELLEEYAVLIGKLEYLVDSEPVVQPPGERRIELERLLLELHTQVEHIQKMWS